MGDVLMYPTKRKRPYNPDPPRGTLVLPENAVRLRPSRGPRTLQEMEADDEALIRYAASRGAKAAPRAPVPALLAVAALVVAKTGTPKERRTCRERCGWAVERLEEIPNIGSEAAKVVKAACRACARCEGI